MENDSSHEKKKDSKLLKYIWILYLAFGFYLFFTISEDSILLIVPLGFLLGVYTLFKTRKNIKYKFIYKTIGIISIVIFILFILFMWAYINADWSK